MAVNFKDAKKIISNLRKGGANLNKGVTITTAAKKIMPVVGAGLILDQIREIPVFSQIMTGLDRLYDLAIDGISKIPVLGWAAEWFSDNVVKPVAGALGGYRYPVKENGKVWYTTTKSDLALVDTVERPAGVGYTEDVTTSSVTGAVPRMFHVNVDLFKIHEMYAFEHTMTDLWENIVNGLKRSVVYSQNQVSAYIINSMMYYIVGKYFEKKLGFIKYSDITYPDFRDDWILTYNQTGSDGINDAVVNPMFDSHDTANGLTHTRENYDIIQEMERNFLLPKNMKEWIDHYFGSVFVLDDDTKNVKYIDVNPITLYFAEYDKASDNIKITERLLTDFTSDVLLDELTSFFKYNASIRADLNNASVFSTSYESKVPLLNIMSTGWFSNLDSYKPSPVKSDTFKQAIINGYTHEFGSESNLKKYFKRDFIRFDFLNNEKCGDEFTTLIFAGGVIPTDNRLLKDGHLAINNIACVISNAKDGSDRTPTTIPATWLVGNEWNTDGNVELDHPAVAIFRSSGTELTETNVSVVPAGTVSEHIEISYANNQTWSDMNVNIDTDAFSTSYISSKTPGTLDVGELLIRFQDHAHNERLLDDRSVVMNELDSVDTMSFYYCFAIDEDGYQWYIDLTFTKENGTSWFDINNNITAEVGSDMLQVGGSGLGGTHYPCLLDPGTNISHSGNTYEPWMVNRRQDTQYELASCHNAISGLSTGDSTIVTGKLPYRDVQATFTVDNVGIFHLGLVIKYNSLFGYELSDTPTDYYSATYNVQAPWTAGVTIVTGETSSATPLVTNTTYNHRLLGYYPWVHQAMGYSIPIGYEVTHSYSLSVAGETTYQGSSDSKVLLKEDYVPMFVSRYDLPWILYYMYSSLLYLELLPYKKQK